jgi:hypothetical protein
MIEEEIFVHNDNRRQVVLIGQNIRRELNLLREIGLDLVADYNPGLLAILDSRSIASALELDVDGEDDKSFGLGPLLEQLAISFGPNDLEDAGKNASLTLRALMGLGVATADRQYGVNDQRKLSILAKVSLGLPPHCSSGDPTKTDRPLNERRDVDPKGKTPIRFGDHIIIIKANV